MDKLNPNEEFLNTSLSQQIPQRQLVFGGCGGMYSYSIGVAATINENFNIGHETLVSGSSAGCFPALLTALNMDIEELFENWNIPFLKEVNSYRFGSLGHWNNIVRKWTLPKLHDNAYKEASGHLYCSMTSFPDFNNHIIGNWTSNKDLLDGVMASSFIPIFDIGKLTCQFRGHRYIDGSLTNSYPQPLGINVPSCIIRRDMWRPNNTSWLWCWSDEDWARQLFKWGKEDAMDHLEELTNVLKTESIIELPN